MKKDLFQVHQIKVGPSWMDPILLFLEKDILPEEKLESEKVRRKAPRFWLSEDKKLYKRSFSRPYLLYVHPEASESLLEELHERICGSHIGGRSLSHRAITQGYWWPGMQRKHKNMLKNVINVKDSRQILISLEEFLILFLVLGPLPYGAWIL